MNPSTAFGRVVVDELIRCGLREAVIAPGSRSAPLAMALFDRSRPAAAAVRARHEQAQNVLVPHVRLHVRTDERSAAYLALGLAKASGRPALVACTSGTAAANFHPAVIEADEACVPLLVLTADRPPELRGTGANQAVDQVKLYGSAVRWYCEAGVPEARAGMAGYWRSLACRAWAQAAGAAGGPPGPVHVNVPFAEPLVPDGDPGWCEPFGGRPGGAVWTRFGAVRPPAACRMALPDTARGVLVCGDGAQNADSLLAAAEEACWPVLAEPSSAARRGPNALSAYPYLLASGEFLAAHRPDVVVSAGRPGLSRQQLAFLRQAARHLVVGQAAGRWADPARSASLVLPPASLAAADDPSPGDCADQAAAPGSGRRVRDPRWLASWQQADAAARAAADEILDSEPLSEPWLARELPAGLPAGSLLWAASSLPIRDLDQHMAPRGDVRVLASRGASGIDGLVSTAIGAALADQAGGGHGAVALLGDLAFLHDVGGLVLGPDEPRPDLTIAVVNNDGGGIFSLLEQAAFPGPFERVFGTPHGADLAAAAAAVRVPHVRLERKSELAQALAACGPGSGLRLVEIRVGRAAGARLRERIQQAATRAAARAGKRSGTRL